MHLSILSNRNTIPTDLSRLLLLAKELSLMKYDSLSGSLTAQFQLQAFQRIKSEIIMDVKLEKSLSGIIVPYFKLQHRCFPGGAELCQVKF
jgi:hypothetical protein